MKLTWLGHSGFRIDFGDQCLLVDPWLTGNPMFPIERRAEAITGATAILISHGHGDHVGDAPAIARELDIPLVGKYDLVGLLEKHHGVRTIGYNNGGTVALGTVAVTLVAASHSSTVAIEGQPVYAGSESGFMIEHGGRTAYFSGDTDVMADMGVFNDLHAPEIGILSCGGHFTMDMKRAAYAARKFFNFKTIVPCHYRTFPLLAQNADALRAGVPPGVRVLEPQVLVPFTV